MKKILQMITVFALIGSIFQYLKVPVHAANPSTIYVDTDDVITNDFQGFGVQWDPSDLYDYTDEQWASFVEKASFLKPNIMRVMIHDGDSYCIGFDENHQPKYNWDSKMMNRVYRILDFAQQNQIPIMIGEWNSPKDRGYLSYDDYGKTVGWDSETWANMINDVLTYLVEQKGYTCIKYYNMINEPNFKGSSSDNRNYWARGIQNLRKVLNENPNEKISNIEIVGPDVYDNWENWLDTTTSDTLRDSIGLHEIHWYANDYQVYNGEVETTLKSLKEKAEKQDPEAASKGFALGEMGIFTGRTNGDQQVRTRDYQYGVEIFDMAVQAMRAGLAFGNAWGFEDSMHIQSNDVINDYKDQYGPAASSEEGKKYEVHTPTGDVKIDNNVKIWGFWNELGEEMSEQNQQAGYEDGTLNNVKASDENLRPWYYSWSMICRYMPGNSKVVNTTASDLQGVRATTVLIPGADGKYDVTIALVNSSDNDQKTNICIPNANSKVNLNQYFYYDGKIDGKKRPENEKGQLEKYQTINDVDLSGNVEVSLPANSCMILTSLGHNGESHPMSFTTGKEIPVSDINIQYDLNPNDLRVGKTYQLNVDFEPSGVYNKDVEWSVSDYFGRETDIASIDQNGLLTVHKLGYFHVNVQLKDDPSINDQVLMKSSSSKNIEETLTSLNNGAAFEYKGLVFDDNPSNFENNKTVKRSENEGYATYDVSDLKGYKFIVYSLKNDLNNNQAFEIQLSRDGKTWDSIDDNVYTKVKDLSSGWKKFEVSKTLDENEYRYLRVILKQYSGFEMYDPQYGGGIIYCGDDNVTELNILNSEKYLQVDNSLELKANMSNDELEWTVLDPQGEPTSLASIDANGKLTAHQKGKIVISARIKDSDIYAYYPLEIVAGYMVDDMDDYSKMYDINNLIYEQPSNKFDDQTILKRSSKDEGTIVYAYENIQHAIFEVYKDGQLSADSVDVYGSQDGLKYQLLDKSIILQGAASNQNSQFKKYDVEVTCDQSYSFIKVVLKNDPSVYAPMIGKAEILYEPTDDSQILSINTIDKEIKLNIGSTKKLDIKYAPAYNKEEIIYTSNNEDVATIDKSGNITAIGVGCTIVKAKAGNETIEIPVNVYDNLALNKDVEASSSYSEMYDAANAVDGDYSTRWSSEYSNDQYFVIDLGKEKKIDTIKLFWETARAKKYNVQIAGDDKNYTVIKELDNLTTESLNDVIQFDAVKARYIKVVGITPATEYGYSIYECEVYNNENIVPVKSIECEKDEIEMYVDEKLDLNMEIKPDNATYYIPVITSSNTHILAVKNNQLIALAPGTAKVTIRVDGIEKVVNVTIVEENAQKIADSITDLTIYDNKVVLPVYDQYTLSLYSSDHEKIIDLNGNVNLPVYDTTVNLVVKVVDQNNQEAYSQPISIHITGNDDSLENINNLLDEVKNIDEDLYKPSTIKNLKAAISSVEQTLATNDLLVSELNDATTLLNQAYQGLEFKEDQTTLQKLIEEIKGLDSKLYTDKSYQSLMEVVEQVESQINDDSSKEEIANAIERLQEAYQQLIKQDDYDLLKQKIEEIEKIDWNLYTSQSQTQLKESLEKAKQYLQSDQMTTQGIYECYYELVQSYGKLQLKADLTTLKALVEKIEKLDLTLYKKESVDYLNAVLKEVKEKMNNDLTQEECQLLLSKLQNAYNGLQLKESKNEKPEAVQTNDTVDVSAYMVLSLITLSGIVLCTKKARRHDF